MSLNGSMMSVRSTQPALLRPARDHVLSNLAEQKVGRPPRVDRRLDRGGLLVDVLSDELDLLAALALECGDQLMDCRILRGGEALLPPHDEVGGTCAERRHGKRRGEN
jgi:hypothetical protein